MSHATRTAGARRRAIHRLGAGLLLGATLAQAARNVEAAAPAADDRKPRDLTPVTWLEAPDHAPVEIVRDGKPMAVVYVADPAGRARYEVYGYRYINSSFPTTLPRLVHELVEAVRLGTGADLERVDQPPPPDRPAIVIGDCEESRRAGIDAANLPWEGFMVRTAPNRVYLVGSTQAMPPGSSGRNEGTAWAVADFLERLVGVRWYWPAEYGGRSIPRRASLAVPPVCYRDQPVFHERLFHPEQTCGLLPLSFAPHYTTAKEMVSLPLPFAPGVLPDGEPLVTFVPHLSLMRFGSSLPYQPAMQGARAYDVAAEAAREKPRVEEMFALKKDGGRNYAVFCYSAPETLDWMLKRCAQSWDKGSPGALHLWFPSTPGLACNCPACRETAATCRDDRELHASLAAQYGTNQVFGMVEKLVHERVFGRFAQRLCEAAKQRWPDRKIIYYPWDTDCPKGVEFPDNLVVHDLNAGFRMGLIHQPVVLREQQDRLRAWRQSIKGSGQVVGWRCGFYGPSDWTYGPVQFPHSVRDFYRANRDIITGSTVPTYSLPCWTTAAPTWYVWMRVLWNPELDVDAVLDEMCRRLFGAGAAAARELLRLECARWEGMTWSRPLLQESMREVGEGSLRFPDDFHFKESWPPDAVARMKALREQALAGTAGDARARQALLYWTWTFDEFVAYAGSIYGGGATNRPATADGAAGNPRPVPRRRGNETPGAAAVAAPVFRTNAQDGAEMALIPAGEFLLGTSEEERAAWRAAYPDRSKAEFIGYMAKHDIAFRPLWSGVSNEQRAAWLKDESVPGEDPSRFADEGPQRKVVLDAYYMYRTEVTVAQYRKFCQATGRAMPPEPRPAVAAGNTPWKWEDRQPIVNVTWQEAKAYADWAGAALPTEAEWEKAARGGDRRVFPWGDDWPPPKGAGNFADQTLGRLPLCPRFYIEGYSDGFLCGSPAGAFEANPYGLYDLAGNVREWCADWYDAGAYKSAPARNPAGPDNGVWHVVRGGSWFDGTPWTFRVACRGDYFHLPVGTSSSLVGFRCVVRVR
jgi:formylglycine-generating enzyme required for sulfatase activity